MALENNKWDRFKNYRRLYPKPKLSWTVYKAYLNNDWTYVFDYLLGKELPITGPQQRGIDIHKDIEVNGLATTKNLSKIPSLEKGKFEEVVHKYYEPFYIIGKIDCLLDDCLLDWKTGGMSGYEAQLQLYMYLCKRKMGYLVSVNDAREVGRVYQYEAWEDGELYWDNRFEQMYLDIEQRIDELDMYARSGTLYKWINFNG